MENYEEKYKELEFLIKNLYPTMNDYQKEKVEGIFSELKESEDEKIRIWLIETQKNWLHDQERGGYMDNKNLINTIKDSITWLEKQKPKQSPKWLYRLEYKDNSCGLWYDGNGKWCFEKGIGSLDDSCKTKTLPMDYDERYKQEGRDWFSSCSNKEDLLHWYSKEDAEELISKGFVFTRYLATEYHEYDKQTVFIKDTALYREEIDFFELMDKQKTVDEEAIMEGVRSNFAISFINYLDANKYKGKMCVSNGECENIEAAFKNADWDKIGRYYNKFTQKPSEWSEEDEGTLACILGHLSTCLKSEAYEMYKNWLKSLKDRYIPQSHWKPSEKQIKVLESLLLQMPYLNEIEEENPGYIFILSKLIDELKLLKDY